MKKFISILLVVIMSLSIVACGSDSPVSDVEECKVYFDIQRNSNLFFGVYDIEVYFDNNRVGLIENGETLTSYLNTTAGSHDITFYKDGDRSISSHNTVNIKSDSTIMVTIDANSSSISCKDCEIFSGIVNNEYKMIDVTGETLNNAVSKLKKVGFLNIKAFDADDNELLSSSEWIVKSQSIDTDVVIEKNTEIILICRIKSSDQEENVQEEKSADGKQEEKTDVESIDEDKITKKESIKQEVPEYAKRAAVVAITNLNATDVYVSPESSVVDADKLHAYADIDEIIDNKTVCYLYDVIDWGKWTTLEENKWHVEKLIVKSQYWSEEWYRMDVSYDGRDYIVSNADFFSSSGGEWVGVGMENDRYHRNIVPKDLVEDDRIS